MRLHPPPNQQPWSAFTVSQKVQLTYKLFLLENARNVLNKELDNLANKAYEDVRGLLNSSFSIRAFKSVSETVEAKCRVIEKLSELLRSASQEDFDEHNNKMHHNQPVKKRDTFKFGPMLQNTIMSSISRAVQVLGALVVPQKCTKRDNKINMNQATVSEVQEKDTVCSATCSTVQDTAVKKETEGKNVEKSRCHKPILLPATCDIVKTNTQELLLPPIPAIPPATEYKEPPVGVPMMKWGHEDDIQVQHQKQTASQLLYFLSAVKAEYTGELEVPVMERSLSPQTCSVQNITEQAYQFKEDDEWSPGMLSETANHMPLFKLKRVDSDLGSLTYTCVIVTKTELWDMGDIVTEFECESSSVSSEETCVAEPSDETLQWVNAAMHKDETTSSKVPTHAITIPEFQNKRFEEIEVVVSHIVTPGNFYIQHADAKEKLQALIADTCEKSVSFAEQHCIPDIGTKVMGWFPQQKQWCRSKVTKICGISKDDNTSNNNNTKEMSITVEVMRLDYGDSLCLPLSNLKELTSEMVILPLQGVQVSLAHVSPVNGRGWSEEAVDWFRDMVHKRTLYARLYPEGPRVAAELFLEKGNIQAMRRGASLSLRLTQNGHARHNKLKAGVGNMKLKMKKKDLEWEKYLISFYTQSHLHKAVL